MTELTYTQRVDRIGEELKTVLRNIDETEVQAFTETLLQADKVFFIGVGRVMLALETMVKRLNHVGINACVVGAINEPPIGEKDVLVVGSGSGESLIPKHIASCAQKYQAKIVHLTSNPESSIAKMADVIVDFHCGSKASSGSYTSIQPMTTLFEQSLMVFGDVVCLEVMKAKGLSFEDASRRHANLE